MTEKLITFKSKLLHILEPYGSKNHEGRWFDWLLILLIIANVLAVMAETVPSINQQYSHQLFWFELVSVGIFTLEYFARLWVCILEESNQTSPIANWRFRIKFMFRPMSIIDLLAILPFYLGMLVNVDLRVLRLLRLTRMLKLGRYSSAMQMLHRVIAKEYRTLIAALSILIMIMVIAATGMYYLERHVQPEHFGSIPQSMWWSVITLSTVGYGDVVPITSAGKFLSSLFILLGVAMFALPAGILASSFTEEMSQRRDRFRSNVLDLLTNGKISLPKLDKLEQMRKTLGLEKDEAAVLFNVLRKQHLSTANEERQADLKNEATQLNLKYCPHCYQALNEDPD